MTPDLFKYMTTNPLAYIIPFDGDAEEGETKPETAIEFTPEQQKLIDARINEVTEGLRKTNTQLKDEKTSVKTRLDEVLNSLGGEDGLKSLKAMQERLSKDELGKMLAEGKHEDWFEAKVGPLRQQYESQIKDLQDQVGQSEEAKTKALHALQDKVLEVDVSMAAAQAKVLNEPGVLRDITRAAREVFKWSDEHEALVREKEGVVVMGKDAKNPQTVAEWLATQTDESRHWWGESVGGGSKGSKGRLPNGLSNPWSKDAWNVTQQGAFIREHGIDRAKEAAASMGSKVGATQPPA